MERIGKPRGLIRYDSLARLAGERTRFLRPRVIVYSVLLVGVVVALFVGLGTRPLLDLVVVRPPGDPFSVLSGGVVSNHFTLRLHNRASESKRLRIEVTGPAQTQVIVPVNPLELAANSEVRTEAFVNVPADRITGGKAPVSIQVFDGSTLLAERPMTFLAPAHR